MASFVTRLWHTVVATILAAVLPTVIATIALLAVAVFVKVSFAGDRFEFFAAIPGFALFAWAQAEITEKISRKFGGASVVVVAAFVTLWYAGAIFSNAMYTDLSFDSNALVAYATCLGGLTGLVWFLRDRKA